MGRIKLRELINKLEEVSENGKNDNLTIEIFELYYVGEYEGIGKVYNDYEIKRYKNNIRIIILYR